MPPAPPFTEKQGQYLAFIYAYTQVLGRAPAETDEHPQAYRAIHRTAQRGRG